MTDVTTGRKCGNCGAAVGLDDVVCPHCDALLAAYEAPTGAAYGSSAAINPVDFHSEPGPERHPVPASDTSPEAMPIGPAAPYVSPTAQSLDSLDAQKPEAAATSTTFDLPESSPVSEALERTRATANLEATPPPDVPEAVIPKALDSEPESEPQSPPQREESPAAGPSRAVERVRAQAEAGWFGGNSEEARDVARKATSSSGERPRPEERASHREQPVSTEGHRQQTANKGQQSPGIGSIVGFFIIVILAMRILGSGSLAGFLLLPVIVAGLIWLMAVVARNSGRKTTSMPKDRRR